MRSAVFAPSTSPPDEKCDHESTKIREDHGEEGEIFFVPFVFSWSRQGF
jgi:hypothetical protein